MQPAADGDPPDPGRVTTQQEFGRELTRARTRARLTVRQVARASGLPPSTAGDYFAGRHLPPPRQPDLLLRLLAACGVTEPAEVDRWQQALRRVHRPPGRRPARAPVPYRGLPSFQPADAGWFFGREELTLHLVRLAGGTAAAGLPLAVVGPSGSGKSSLLRAGLYPRLRAGTPARPDGRPVVLLTPGPAPVRTLAQALAALAVPGGQPEAGPASCEDWLRSASRDCTRLLRLTGDRAPAIIADQFEELFAAGVSEPERRCYLGALQALSNATLVVFGLRADFYGHALRYQELARSLQDRQIVVGPMTARQLRRAILEPAAKAGLRVEDGLAEVLLRDLRPPWGEPAAGAGHEVGALPLLSHALLATWHRRSDDRLTIAGYQASGGVSGAVAQSAEAVYGRLGTTERDLARQLFLRLVHVESGGRETRTQLALASLPGRWDSGAASALLGRFAAHRLLTVGSTTVQIAHEALLDAWPRLRSWLDSARDDAPARRPPRIQPGPGPDPGEQGDR